MILTVDLAAKYTAGMVRARSGEVHSEFDSIGKSSFGLCDVIAENVQIWKPELIIVEDVPYGISSQAMVKPVTRLQGALMHALADSLDRMVFLNPSTWQKNYPGVGSAPKELTKAQKDLYRIEAARKHAEDRGYTAPNLVQAYIDSLPAGTKVLKKNTAHLSKVMTDYVDCFLMSDWAYGFPSLEDLSTMSGVQPANI